MPTALSLGINEQSKGPAEATAKEAL